MLDASADWTGVDVLVAGAGVSGFAAADALARRGARVRVVDGRDGLFEQERADLLRAVGAHVRLGAGAVQDWPTAVGGQPPDLVVTSPGWRPDQPLLVAAQRAGVPVWGEVELAWRLRPAGGGPPWLTLTGTNGKTTVVRMLDAMLRAAGLRSVAAGNVGRPVLDAVLATGPSDGRSADRHPSGGLPPGGRSSGGRSVRDHGGGPYDVLAVELSSFQLHWLGPDREHSIAPLASAVLNVQPDHLDWHGSLAAYARDKGEVYHRTRVACVYNVQDPQTEQLVRDADVADGCRAIGFTTGVPAVGMLGVVDGVLADRAFVAEGATSAVELATVGDIQRFASLAEPDAQSDGEPGLEPGLERGAVAPHVVSNALAAAALARAAGVPPHAVRDGLRGFRPDPHRLETVAVIDAVTYVDDSKATNPAAADAALAAFGQVVWVAGGLLKGADVDGVVARHAARLRAAVLIGRDRAQLAVAIRRHAPDVPVVEVPSTDTDAMDDVVRAAAGLARPGDVVLLAPAAASMDMFRDYAARGEAFADAVRRRPGPRAG
ncbi:MAG: UDP-N-acetylmuramoyl-L-alanine--D-glutamate ligase [Angustibacter sp.]